jgi:diguanylate cyclase (GGDEF)-like protein/putative nucleotidyltransferase with HDIG domain
VLVILTVLLLVCGAIVAVGRLQSQATGARDAQLKLMNLRLDLAQIQQVPWGAAPDEGDDPNDVRDELLGDQQQIESVLVQLSRKPGLPERAAIERPFQQTMAALWEIFRLVSHGKGDATAKPSDLAARQAAAADQQLAKAAKRYRADSVAALRKSRFGSAAVILLLFLAFVGVYHRAHRARLTAETLASENRRLLAASRTEALTDALTSLGNRRALMLELESRRPSVEGEQLMLALFDLDGFKQYNDSFGHPAGDSLLARLGARLAETVEGIGTAYRMGGDEFCVLAHVPEDRAEAIAGLGAAALSEEGLGFAIHCSYGVSLIPRDTTSAEQALRLADQRMYDQKDSHRSSAERQSANALVALLAERRRELGRHTIEVATLSDAVAERLGLDPGEIVRIRLGAELHDVGKVAVPDTILMKPGELDESEWEFLRGHTVVGERIARAAPSLATAADLVRAHHERLDGSGYPDGLRGDEIPLGARVIGACDAFVGMISNRPQRTAMSVADALAELRRGAGDQFDPNVVAALAAVIDERVRAV